MTTSWRVGRNAAIVWGSDIRVCANAGEVTTASEIAAQNAIDRLIAMRATASRAKLFSFLTIRYPVLPVRQGTIDCAQGLTWTTLPCSIDATKLITAAGHRTRLPRVGYGPLDREGDNPFDGGRFVSIAGPSATPGANSSLVPV